MFFFRDPQEGRRIKRIVRDHVHFREEIVELAERIVNRLEDFQFSCLHVRIIVLSCLIVKQIRRNEFQFEEAWTDAPTIVSNTKHLFKKGEKIYISTDELSDEKEKKAKWSDPT